MIISVRNSQFYVDEWDRDRSYLNPQGHLCSVVPIIELSLMHVTCHRFGGDSNNDLVI